VYLAFAAATIHRQPAGRRRARHRRAHRTAPWELRRRPASTPPTALTTAT